MGERELLAQTGDLLALRTSLLQRRSCVCSEPSLARSLTGRRGGAVAVLSRSRSISRRKSGCS